MAALKRTSRSCFDVDTGDTSKDCVSPYADATSLLRLLHTGAVSSADLLERFITRAEQYNDAGCNPLNAIVVKDYARARARAAAADASRAAGHLWGPLHGLPMTVKENHAVKDMRRTWGNVNNKDDVVKQNSVAIQRLVDAGAIIYGKTNLPKNCKDWETYNEVYGNTRNPWDRRCSCGGSSGGGAAAVAAGLTPLEFGGDVAGSIRVPASFCGVFGLAPTYDLVPMPWSKNKDLAVNGPMARSVDDIELLLAVLAGDPGAGTYAGHSSSTMQEDTGPEFKRHRTYTPPMRRSLRRVGLSGFRIAVLPDEKKICAVGNAVRQTIADLVAELAKLEVTMKQFPAEGGLKVDHPDGASRGEVNLASQESFQTYIKLLSSKQCTPKGSNESVEAEKEAQKAAQIEQGKEGLLTMYWTARSMSHGDWLDVNAERHVLQRAWARFFEDHDVLIAPLSPCLAFEAQEPRGETAYTPGRTLTIDGEARNYAMLYFWPHMSIVAGIPSLALPLGLDPVSGLPRGVQVIGPANSERHLLHFARLLVQEGIAGCPDWPPKGFPAGFEEH